MRSALKAEVRKTAANPTVWWLLLAAAGLGALSTYLVVALGDVEGTELLTDHKLQEAVHGASVGSILVTVAGIVGMAGEWRFGQASQTFLGNARRWQVVGAKAIVYAAVGVLYGLVSSITATVAASAAYRAEDLTLPLDRSAVWLTLLGVVAAAMLLGLLGVAIGALLRNQVVGIVVALGWFFLFEPTLWGASTSVARWLPGNASTALARFPDDANLSPGMAAIVLSGVVAVGLALGGRLVARADITD